MYNENTNLSGRTVWSNVQGILDIYHIYLIRHISPTKMWEI